MERPCNAPCQIRVQQLKEMLEEERRNMAKKDCIIKGLEQKIGHIIRKSVEEKVELEVRLAEKDCEIEWLKRQLLVAETRLEEKRQNSPMTIIYGNNATPVYDSTIHKQSNSINHNQKNDMNIENFYNNGEIKQLGDGNTMHVHSAWQQEMQLTPSQEKAKEALITLCTEGRWEKQQWWAVWKVMMSLHLVNKSAREFADYLVDLGVTADNVYNNIYKLDAEFRNISAVNATEWQQYNGKYGDKYQKQIDTASRLLTLLAE